MPTKDYSSAQEHMIADYLGWSVVAGSGAAACYPGDIISDEWLGECKTHVETGKKIFFSYSVWKKICDEASVKHRFPVLFTDDGSQKSNKTWCLIPYRCVDETKCSRYRIDKEVRTNINFVHDAMIVQYNIFNTSSVEKSAVFTAVWHGEHVALLPLQVFKELYCD